MIIVSSAKMGNGTFQAKYDPIAELDYVEKIYVLRKEKGPEVKKLEYILLPKICRNIVANLLLTPILLTYYAIRLKADLILVYHFIPHAFFGFFAHFITRKPYIIGQTGLDIQKIAVKPIIGKIVNLIARKAYKLNVPGTQSQKFWIDQEIDSENINILHSTIDTNHFVSENKTPEYDFIYLGRLAPVKQINLIIDAIDVLRTKNIHCRLVIVGDGEEEEKLKAMVQEKSLSDIIDFVGFQINTKDWFNKASVSLMSSESEGLPTSLMQAMACERICISSDAGNIPDIIKHKENGFIFKSGDRSQLPILMEDVLINSNTDSEIRKKARQSIIKNHSYQSATAQWNVILTKL